MRLLNVATLALEEFVGEIGHGIPVYAILSHTWEGEDEVSFTDYVEQKYPHKKGYEKIRSFCQLAESEGFQYLWVDTCCIDKTSSAELSEAINSMFQWYQDAGVCYAYLADVKSSEDPTDRCSSFSLSRWFTRGWTLQELIGPAEVVFLGSDWVEIGTKKSLRDTLSIITRINDEALDGCWDKYSVAQKMSWAAGRRTTRPEDEAYCLMGLFDINMPLLYGEGRKAFLRLQQEILKVSEDQLIFAWSTPETNHSHTQLSGLLASSPEKFREASRIEVSGHGEVYENPFELVNRMVRIRLRLLNNVKAMKLGMLLSEPSLSSVLQVHQDGECEGEDLSKHSISSTPQVQVDQGVENNVNEMAQENQFMMPIIKIESDDGGGEPSHKASEIDSGTASSVSSIHASSVIEPKSQSPDGHEYWVWYIYEPVVVAPLRCRIGNNPLGILLSRGSVEGTGLRVLSRLHKPSIVAINAISPSSFASLTTTYASISTSKTTARKFGDSWGLDRFSWPEIRVAGVLSAGYVFFEECGVGWSVDASRTVLRQARKFQSEHDMVECTPLLVFYHESGNEAAHPTFFVTIAKYSKLSRTCSVYLGLARAGAAALLILDYKLFSIDLAHERRVEVPLGDKETLVVKLREGGTSTFISMSIETTGRWKIRGEDKLCELSKKGWLNSRLFPMLRLLQKNSSIGLGGLGG